MTATATATATVAPTDTATVTNTATETASATATETITLTPAAANVTLTPDFTNCANGSGYGWLVYINMDTNQTSSTLTYTFASGATQNVSRLNFGYSAENRYWASYSTFAYPNDVLQSVTGTIPGGTNPVALVYGALFLGEPIALSALVGLALVVLGILLANGVIRWPAARPAVARSAASKQ